MLRTLRALVDGVVWGFSIAVGWIAAFLLIGAVAA
jgi:hypothetical protein